MLPCGNVTVKTIALGGQSEHRADLSVRPLDFEGVTRNEAPPGFERETSESGEIRTNAAESLASAGALQLDHWRRRVVVGSVARWKGTGPVSYLHRIAPADAV